MLEQSYLYRSKTSRTRLLLYPVVLQITGVLLFVVLARLLTVVGLSFNYVLFTCSALALLYILVTTHALHAPILNAVASGIWPLEFLEDAYRIVEAFDEIIDEFVRLQRRTERLLLDSAEIRKSAQSMRATSLAKEADENYQEVLRIRRDIKQKIESLEQDRASLIDTIKEIEEDPSISLSVLNAYGGPLKAARQSREMISERERNVARQNRSMVRQLGLT